jgi:cytochrome b561
MLASALVAQAFFDRSRGQRKLLIQFTASLGFILSFSLLPDYLPALFPTLTEQNANYLAYSRGAASSGSLGLAFIINQPAPIKLILGSIWILLFPLPVWSGFQLESAYHLFKSLNAIYMYFVVPLVGLAVLGIVRQERNRTPVAMFHLFVVVGFLLAVVMTSTETRHFSTFFVAMFMVALQPDLTRRTVRRNYKNVLFVYLMGISLLHVMWALLKLL